MNKQKNILFIMLSCLLISHIVTAQFSSLPDLFEEGDHFSEKSSFIWGDYQLLSTIGNRPDKIRTIIPAVALNYERQLIHNLGLRLSMSTSWWEEDKVLVTTPTEDFAERFTYQYWVASGGLTWHFNLDDSKLDPYVGLMGSYRLIAATCECNSATSSTFSVDPFIGTRYFLGTNFYLSAEVGRNGVGYAKVGLGFRFD